MSERKVEAIRSSRMTQVHIPRNIYKTATLFKDAIKVGSFNNFGPKSVGMTVVIQLMLLTWFTGPTFLLLETVVKTKGRLFIYNFRVCSKNETNYPMSSNSHPLTTVNKAKHCLKWGRLLQNQWAHHIIWQSMKRCTGRAVRIIILDKGCL